MPNTFTRSISTAAAIAAVTSAFTFAAPAIAAPSADACAAQLGSAGIPLGQAAYAAQFGAEQEPIRNHEFIYHDLATARTYLQGGQCDGFANVVKAEVDFALGRITAGETSLRAGDWASTATALTAADKAVYSARSKVWKIAHP
ncbi:hypothetical protein ACIA8G_31085 [Lentzea sp. NPDC051213]|uniref:hypothetical protein n=1 Tax=Lentzea sp. NPDC051213 TaxID=3364126 RepID=UPI0037B511D5